MLRDMRRHAGVQFLDVFKRTLTNNTASAYETYGGIPIEYSLKFYIFQIKKELHEFKATNPISTKIYFIERDSELFIFYIEQALKMMMVEIKIKAPGHHTVFEIASVSNFKSYLECNSLAQVGNFWAAEFLKEFENTLQNNPINVSPTKHYFYSTCS